MKELIIIGGGPAGMAAALSAYEQGVFDILILERDRELGGMLNQCIHSGFGLHTFGEELTGPEYAIRYKKMIEEKEIPFLLNTMVIDVQGGSSCVVTAMNSEKGMFRIEARAVVLAMGCREKARGAMNIPGYRPSGIYSAGTAQRFVNREGRMPGKEVVVLGSGDIGLIMARRMTLQGATVKMVAEIMPYSGGLKRNIVQCLDDFHIPLKLGRTVTRIHGERRVEGVTISRVDENLKPIAGSEEYVACDTLLLSCGLIPENELSESAGAKMDSGTKGPVVNGRLQTTVEGIFACGNVLHVHDLVDNVSKEAAKAGEFAAEYIRSQIAKEADADSAERQSCLEDDRKDWEEAVSLKVPPKSKCVLPEDWDPSESLICIGCPVGCLITAKKQEDGSFSVTGNTCKKGEEYALNEMTHPKRGVTFVVNVSGGCADVVSVKTAVEIPKDKIWDCVKELKQLTYPAPICAGEVLVENIAGTGVAVVATCNVEVK